jgi:cytochrome c-type biogenesis protein CcmH/NrfG
MKRGIQACLVMAILLFAVAVQAKTASEVFESVSASIVVIGTYDAKGTALGLSSGVAVASDVIATNSHAIKDAAKVQVMRRGKEYPASLPHCDWDRDVCTFTVSGINAPAVKTGSTSRLKVGERVYAVSAPQGLELTLSEGIISSLHPVEGGGQYIQISAPISLGSGGGGLFDEEGRLIGLLTFYLAEGQQINFAVPVEWIPELPKRHKETVQATETTTITMNWLNEAMALFDKKDWISLLAHALRWAKEQPKEADAWKYLANAYWQTGKFTNAIEAYQQALRIQPEDAVSWYNLGVYYWQTGQTAKAIEAYKKSLGNNPKFADAWCALGNAYWHSGQRTKAIEAYQQALRIRPDDAFTWLFLGIVYRETGQTAKAMEVYERLKAIDPETADMLF